MKESCEVFGETLEADSREELKKKVWQSCKSLLTAKKKCREKA